MDDRQSGRAPRRPDPLGLRRVLGDRLLPVMVAAMTFLAALALGGAITAQHWADRWRLGAGTSLTVLVPHPGEAAAGPSTAAAQSRLDRSLTLLRGSPAVASARPLSPQELDALLRPWLGPQAAVASKPASPAEPAPSAQPSSWAGEIIPSDLLPAVIAVRVADTAPGGDAALDRLGEALQADVPGASLESHAAWVGRLARLLRALEACGWGALLLVATIATLVVAAATRAGLVARRNTVDILHGLGATDAYVASRFARRAMLLAAAGGAIGTLLAVPVMLGLSQLGAPVPQAAAAAVLPTPLWIGLAMLPAVAAMIGYATAHGTVRLWLRRLP